MMFPLLNIILLLLFLFTGLPALSQGEDQRRRQSGASFG